ncbi:MAG: L,D-transpeptidase family protein [Candidatus Omnitrophica bacterium]|nr:L,D-transpeptidase family protein [Candidatus Omnitrophota bacterium]
MNRGIIIFGGGLLVFMLVWMSFPKGKNSENVAQNQISPVVAEFYSKATRLKKEGDILQAKEVYLEILRDHSDVENIATIQKELEDLNLDILFSSTPVPEKSAIHKVVVGDTLGKISKKYGVTIELIKKSNHLKSDVIRVGQKLRIWQGSFNVFVDKSQNILILKDGEEVVKAYSVATGENNSTPVGTFKITTKLIDPVWFNRGVVVPPESPENALGTRWLGFDLPGYGIHGTPEPDTIGEQVTAGCVRMRNEEVEELYGIVPQGTEVTVVD